MGTDNGFELERASTRGESAVMTVRLLGKENEAKQKNFTHPFVDVPEWANAYVGYLYFNNITSGVADDLFGSTQAATSEQYATFILRALGYDDSAGDFDWNKSLEKMVSLGILTNEQTAEFSADTGGLRNDMVAISFFSLFAKLKDSDTLLLDKLYTNDEAITTEQLKQASILDSRLTMYSNALGICKPYPSGEALSSEEIYAKVSDAVFRIDTKIMSDTDAGFGSGFFITSDGLAVTNLHVIHYMSSATITTTNGSKYPVEGVIALNTKADLAIIKITGNGFSFLELGDPDLLRSAQRIYCLGSPHGLDNTFSDGLVSTLKRELEEFTYIQISAPIAPGSSGGPLLNEYGQVVGVNSLRWADEESFNMAVPISHLSEVYRFPKIRTVRYMQAHSHFGLWPLGTTYLEIGPNDEEPTQIMENDARMYGGIAGVDDVDYYMLNITEECELFICLTSDVSHSANLKFEVSDPSGAIILNSRHYNEEIFSFSTGYCSVIGKYIIKIYAEDEDNDHDWDYVSYELFWIGQKSNRNSGDTIEYFNEMSLLLEFEPNDDPDHANYLPDNHIYLATISTKDDVDYYTFTLTKKQTYSAAILCNKEKSILNAEVFDVNNKSVGKFRYYDNRESYSETLPAGIYYIKVSVKDTKMTWDNEFYSIAGWTK